jgi:GntR family transcriptional regulator
MLISLDSRDPRPIYLQIVGAVKAQIRAGTLKTGKALPSVREVAEALGVNLHTVHRAYQKLRDQGVITLRLGQRARVAPVTLTTPSREVIERDLSGRVRELIIEAYHMGITADEFRDLVDELLDEAPEGSAR